MSCGDCTGEDPQGCFDGGTEQHEFDSLEKAIEYAERVTKDVGPWEYMLIDVETEKELTKEEINPVFRKLYGYDYA
ncbi:MAG TPA: hypothetical protein VF941_03015 [Clostridia bacterium]